MFYMLFQLYIIYCIMIFLYHPISFKFIERFEFINNYLVYTSFLFLIFSPITLFFYFKNVY